MRIGSHDFAVCESSAALGAEARLQGSFFEALLRTGVAMASELALSAPTATFEAARALVQYVVSGVIDPAPLLGPQQFSHLLSLALLGHATHLPAVHSAALDALGTALRDDFDARKEEGDIDNSAVLALLQMIDSAELSEPALVHEVLSRAAACYTALGGEQFQPVRWSVSNETQRSMLKRKAPSKATDGLPQRGSAAFAYWIVQRPELAALGESMRGRLVRELGSENLKRLLDCKEQFSKHCSWLDEHCSELKRPCEFGCINTYDAAVEEAHERLEELQAKRPRLGHTIGMVHETTDEERQLAITLNTMREDLERRYLAALGCEDGEDGEDEAILELLRE